MKTKQARKSQALSTLNKFYPGITVLIDAAKPLTIAVSDEDMKKAHKQDHIGCPMALACKRELHCQGVIISRSTAYVVNGPVAIRYRVPEATAREIVSFDKGAGFSPGVYRLTPHSTKLGRRHPGDPGEGAKSHSGNLHKRFRHITTGIRAALR